MKNFSKLALASALSILMVGSAFAGGAGGSGGVDAYGHKTKTSGSLTLSSNNRGNSANMSLSGSASGCGSSGVSLGGVVMPSGGGRHAD